MSETIILNLPDPLVARARAVATQTERHLEDVLLEWLDRAATDVPIELLPDAQILALRDDELSRDQQEQLSRLLERQREGLLTAPERVQLQELLGLYRRGMVRKAQALSIAVARGLQTPVD
ncbi:hypothetical protein [Candidatus Viridilinea mediisalina]|uniref:Uncharacterized protein n=1 Tax=Candidatus Viridilinea mediisalina TaxID=2024553 RepID=A0A2A6RGM0_9CHLR|nr:hypothetical protein [Candidatus Viridilinea mediisalina]PDW02274.1 hypothetical protein CJ255_14870 [Candidatus Viridilinea mediisalina]